MRMGLGLSLGYRGAAGVFGASDVTGDPALVFSAPLSTMASASDLTAKGLTFSRSTAGTRFNSAGLLVTEAVDAPRFDYDPVTLSARGLMTEPARTNLLLQNSSVHLTPWTKASAPTVTLASGAAPDGTNSLQKVTYPASSYITQLVTTSVQAYTHSYYVKKFDTPWLYLGIYLTTDVGCWFNLDTVAVGSSIGGASGKITNVGGGMYRIETTFTGAVGSTNFTCPFAVGADGSFTRTGLSLYLWGAQAEAGSFASSPIATTTAAVPRAADLCTSVSIPWLNAAEGTFVVEAQGMDPAASVFMQLDAGADSDRHLIASNGSSTQVGSVNQASFARTADKSFHRIAYAYKANDFGHSLDGATASTPDASGSLPTPTTLRIGASIAGGAGAWIRSITYYNARKADGSLPALTALAPVPLTGASIVGTAQDGQTLTATPGTFSGATSSVTGQWNKNGVAISGATALTYLVATGDRGAVITYTSAASNSAGAASVTSLGATIKDSRILSLFTGSEEGAVYDFSVMSSLYSDAGLTQVSTGGLVAQANDLSGRGHHLSSSGTLRPYASGVPVALGAELLTNGTFATDTDWTKGAGWTIASGIATKAAGTASSLSQAVSLTPGSVYAIFVDISRTAGTLQARLTGGTDVLGEAMNTTRTQTEYLIAATGNTTLEFYADAAFAGTVKTAYLRLGSQLAHTGLAGNGISQRMLTGNVNLSATNKMTIAVSFWEDRRSSIAIPYEVGALVATSTSGSFMRRTNNADSFYVMGGLTRSASAYHSHSEIIELDFSQVAKEDQFTLRRSGVADTVSPGGTAQTVAALPNQPISVFATSNAQSYFRGVIRKMLVVNRAVTSGERANIDAWVKSGPRCAAVGDSTVAANSPADGLPSYSWSVPGFLPDAEFDNFNIATSGEKIAQQKTRWVALTNKTSLDAVFVQIGLNDANTYAITKTSAQLIADLQDLVTTIRADVSAGCKIYICAMNPARGWLGNAGNQAAAYAQWQAMNTAIAGGGSTPITGVDARISSHVAALSDGSDYLAAQFDHNGDGVHENNYGRFIIAQAWRAQLIADGLIVT